MVKKRSIGIDGITTSMCLEPSFWDEIDRRSIAVGIPWQNFVRQLLKRKEDYSNRSAAVRESLLDLMREDIKESVKENTEAWWRLETHSGVVEIGTRGKILYAGRSTKNNIIINDKEVSERHLMLCWDQNNWWAIDLETKNGTYFQNKKIESIKLTAGLSVVLGESKLKLLE